MSQEGDQNPTAADRQVMLEAEEVEILAGMANQSNEVETLRTELLNANRKRRTESVEEGSLVWVRNETINPGTSRKLNPRWTGPFKVTEVYRDGAK